MEVVEHWMQKELPIKNSEKKMGFWNNVAEIWWAHRNDTVVYFFFFFFPANGDNINNKTRKTSAHLSTTNHSQLFLILLNLNINRDILGNL